jgi:predicted LPLAT superfamily acyltransferase
MTQPEATGEVWATRGERGAMAAIRLIVWIALHLGRTATRMLLYPICLYFLAFSKSSRRASDDYLRRVLGRESRFGERFRHYHYFAACVLDRVYLLNNQLALFEIDAEGDDIPKSEIARDEGCFLFGAHIGSFEILRALGHQQPGLKLSLLMYEENARKINSVLNAINPGLVIEVIALGQPGAMLAVEQRLDQGHVIGVLADRGLSLDDDDEYMSVDFLGEPARFPLGPFRLASILQRRVVLMVGLYRGGWRYDVHFERLADFTDVPREARPAAIVQAIRDYAARLEHFCRIAPYNWFNFYDFWQ